MCFLTWTLSAPWSLGPGIRHCPLHRGYRQKFSCSLKASILGEQGQVYTGKTIWDNGNATKRKIGWGDRATFNWVSGKASWRAGIYFNWGLSEDVSTAYWAQQRLSQGDGQGDLWGAEGWPPNRATLRMDHANTPRQWALKPLPACPSLQF